MKRIKAKGIKVIVYEPALKETTFFGSKVIEDITEFKIASDIIVTNRNAKALRDVDKKCFSRDVFGNS